MASESVNVDLAYIHSLHRQYYGDSTTTSAAHTPIIPPVDDDDVSANQRSVFQNPNPFQSSQPLMIQTNNAANHINQPHFNMSLHYGENPFDVQQAQLQQRFRRAPPPDMFRTVDWRNAEKSESLKRAPSAESTTSVGGKVKTPKEHGILRRTSQRYAKIARSVKDLGQKSRRSSNESNSDMMEGVESTMTALEHATSSSSTLASQVSGVMPPQHNKGIHRFYPHNKFMASLKTPRHDTPQPVNTDGLPRSSPVTLPSQRDDYYPYSTHDTTTAGEAARRAAAASNSARFHQYTHSSTMHQTTRHHYHIARDQFRNSIGSIPGASDSGADLVAFDDTDMMDADKEVRLDPVQQLPTEIVTLIFSHLDPQALKKCQKVSKPWAALAVDPLVWRTQFMKQYEKRVYVDPAPIQIGGVGTGLANVPIQNWELMYDARQRINRNWEAGQNGGKAVYLSGHTDSVYCVQFDEKKIITGSRDRTIRVWDINTLRCVKVIGGPTVKPIGGPKPLKTVNEAYVAKVVPSVNGTSYGDSIYHVPSDFHSASILCLQYDEEILVTGSSDNDLLVWNVDTFEPLRRLTQHTGGVLDVAFDSKHIISCSKDCTIIVWDRKTLKPIRTLTGHRGPVNAVQLRGNLLVSASGDGVARLWDLNKMECVREFPPKERGLAAVEFSDDAKYVLAGGNDHITYKFDVATGAEVKTFDGHTQLVRSLFLDTQNGRVVSGSYDLDLRVYDYETGALLGCFNEWTTSWMLAAKCDYRRIVSTSQDGRILMIDFGLDRNARPIPGVELLGSVRNYNKVPYV